MSRPGRLLAVWVLIGWSLVARSADGSAGSTPAAGPPAPELTGGGPWFNTPAGQALTLAGLRGKVVLVEFWTGGCINCLNTLPAVRQWYAKHNDRGFVVIGVHSPEFKHEYSEAYVRRRVLELGLRYPVVMDNGFRIWRAYNNVYWPTLYLIDKTGRLRYKHIGEGYYDVTEERIRKLLAEPVN